MSNTKVSELPSQSTFPSGFYVPVIQSSGTTNTSYKISSADLKTACTGPIGPDGPQGPNGKSGYDAVVDAGGTFDYTTVGAALADGNVNIFVNNGSYTETYWDCTSKNVTITGQSTVGVVVTFNNTDSHSACYINCSSGTSFNCKNINFSVTLTDPNIYFVYSSTSFVGIPFRFDSCNITYAIGNDGSGTARSIINVTSGSGAITSPSGKLFPVLPTQNGFFNCNFYTTWDYNTTLMSVTKTVYTNFIGCSFKTSTTAGNMYFQNIQNFTDCYFEVWKLASGSLHLYNSVISFIGANGKVSSGSPASWDGVLQLGAVIQSKIIDNSNALSTFTAVTCFYDIIDSEIILLSNAATLNLGGGGIYTKTLGSHFTTAGAVNCYGFKVIGCNFYAISTFTVSNSTTGNTQIANNMISYNCVFGATGGFYSNNIIYGTVSFGTFAEQLFNGNKCGNITIAAAADNCVLTGNICGTITVDANSNYNVITGNQNGAITDNGTGTIKVGNLNN